VNRKESAKEFIARLKSLPDPNLRDKKTIREFCERIDKVVRPEIEKQDRLKAKSLSAAITKVVW
jgi:hypothetical protein